MLNYLLLLLAISAVLCDKRPNFVLILTDDQDVVLDGMDPMEFVRNNIAQEGVTFTNSFTTSPICCPSRSSLLTGLYVHNHQAHNNSINGGCYGEQWRSEHEMNTFAKIMHDDGYDTFYAGKYLNNYGKEEAGGPTVVPPGWTDWHGMVGNSRYYNYTLSNNGVPTFSEDLYLTDVISELAVKFIDNRLSSPTPFVAVVAPPAPHAPFTPAPRHRHLYHNATAPRGDNFNDAYQDKHWLIQLPPTPLPDAVLPELDRVHRARWQTLAAVDEMVAAIVGALENDGLLDNTYIIYTSDNGYHIGQFSQVYDKRQPYESDIRVPLVMRGPGIAPNKLDPRPVLNIDLAPTILRLAGIKPPPAMDGTAITFEKETQDAKAHRASERNILVEYYGEGNTDTVSDECGWKYDGQELSECYPWYGCKCQDARNNTFACVRRVADNVDLKYCQFYDNENFLEIYDLAEDPMELTNIRDQTFPIVKCWYKLLLDQLLKCKGADQCGQIRLDSRGRC